MVRGPHWFRRLLAGVTVEEVQRFDAALDMTTTRFERRPGGTTESWHQAAEHDLANAIRHRDAYELEAAWSALKSANREVVRSFDASELVSEARVIRNEALEKLSGWRRESVADLLPSELLDRVNLVSGGLTVERVVRSGDEPAEEDDAAAPADGPDDVAAEPAARCGSLVDDLRSRLVEAKWVVDTESDNRYHKYRILRRAVISTTVAYAVFLGALVAVVALDWVPDGLVVEDSPLGSWQLMIVVMALGVVGAFFSSATELRNRDDKIRIPDLRVRYTLMAMRPVVGAAGAVVVIVVLQSALGDAVELASTAIFGVAIAAGFTERLVTNTVSSAANAIGG